MVGSGDHLNIRTPMQWTDGANAGFTTGSPWNYIQYNYAQYNVEDEDADPGSLLEWYKTLIHARNASPALRRGTHEPLATSDSRVLAFVREHETQRVLVMVNTSSSSVGSVTLTGSALSLEPGEHTLNDLLDPGDTLDVTVTPSYTIEGVSLSGHETAVYEFADSSGVDPGDDDEPQTGLLLRPSFPNPFGPMTTISYALPADSHVRLGVYDVAGREVALLENGVRSEGPHEFRWDGTEADGEPLATGVYFVRLAAGGEVRNSKVVLVR